MQIDAGLKYWLICLLLVGGACSESAQQQEQASTVAPVSSLKPEPTLAPGLLALLIPHWGASPYWERGTEQRLYYGTEATGSSRFAWEEHLGLVSGENTAQTWLWTGGQAAGSSSDTLVTGPVQFALRAKRNQYASPLEVTWGGDSTPWQNAAMPAALLPFWLRQMAFRPGLQGSIPVEPQAGSLLPTGERAFTVRLVVGAPDSVSFQGEQWATWPVELYTGEQVIAKLWFERRYPNGLVRWENLRGDTRQLRTARQLAPAHTDSIR